MYIKTEKIRLLFLLCNKKNQKTITSELMEYCYDPSPELSRIALEMLWRISLKLEVCLNSVLKIFQKLLKDSKTNNFINHLFNEICIGLQYIQRKYNKKAQISPLIDNLLEGWEKTNESEAKISFLYFFVKFGFRKKELVIQILKDVCEDFQNEESDVQLVSLTALMKYYLDYPKQLEKLTQKIFKYCSEYSENPDLRDRAFIYWRLISNAP